MFNEMVEKLGQQFGGVKQFLSGLQYPVNKQSLIQFAQSKGANQTILSLLDRIPDKQYRDEDEVAQEFERTATSQEVVQPAGV